MQDTVDEAIHGLQEHAQEVADETFDEVVDVGFGSHDPNDDMVEVSVQGRVKMHLDEAVERFVVGISKGEVRGYVRENVADGFDVSGHHIDKILVRPKDSDEVRVSFDSDSRFRLSESNIKDTPFRFRMAVPEKGLVWIVANYDELREEIN